MPNNKQKALNALRKMNLTKDNRDQRFEEDEFD